MASSPAKPTRRRPLQKRSQATVTVILEATAQVLVREGPERTTTNRIAERAGVSVGTIYQYFPNKQALYVALAERHVRRIEAEITAVVEALDVDAPLPVEAVAPLVVTTMLRSERAAPEVSRQLYRLAAQDAAVLAPVAAFERDQVARFAGLIALYGGEPGFRPVPAELAATILVRALGGVMRATLAATPERLDDPVFAAELVRLVDGYLRA